jgi:hypothetical protein
LYDIAYRPRRACKTSHEYPGDTVFILVVRSGDMMNLLWQG